MESKGMKLIEFSNSCQIPYKTMQNYMLGTRKIGLEALININLHLGVNTNWLLTGKGGMFNQEERRDSSELEPILAWLGLWWENADEKQRHWLEIQMKRCFPEYEQAQKKD